VVATTMQPAPGSPTVATCQQRSKGEAGQPSTVSARDEARILPEPNHRPNPSLGLGPGDPHAPPYNHEMSRRLQALGLQAGGQFGVAHNSNGNGVWLAYMVIPRRRGIAAEGSSPDFAVGPIIPNGLFPIHVKGIAERFGAVFDPALADFFVPPLDASLDPPFYVDGPATSGSSSQPTATSPRPVPIPPATSPGRSRCSTEPATGGRSRPGSRSAGRSAPHRARHAPSRNDHDRQDSQRIRHQPCG
jgi:hypothetical protein